MAKECTLSAGKLPMRGLPRKSVVMVTDRVDMTSAVYCECLKQQMKQNKTLE